LPPLRPPAKQRANWCGSFAMVRTPLPIGEVLARMVGAALVVVELKARPQDTELLVAMHRWNAQHA
jgi:hypothetical protein